VRIGLFFGSFNPVHVGHMIIANYMVTHTEMDKLWMVVSPQNPFKEKKSLANNYDRLHLLQLALDNNSMITASDIEFSLPVPSYTIDTLTYLHEKYPDHEYVLIMGGDNLYSLHKWKNYELLLERYQIYVYTRPTHEIPDIAEHPNVHLFDAPLLDISSSYIRNEIAEARSIRYLVPDRVYEYLMANTLYKKKTQ